MATKDEHYLKVAESFYEGGAAWGNSWDEKNSGCMVGHNQSTECAQLYTTNKEHPINVITAMN